jgi:hypothetical protein
MRGACWRKGGWGRINPPFRVIIRNDNSAAERGELCRSKPSAVCRSPSSPNPAPSPLPRQVISRYFIFTTRSSSKVDSTRETRRKCWESELFAAGIMFFKKNLHQDKPSIANECVYEIPTCDMAWTPNSQEALAPLERFDPPAHPPFLQQVPPNP